MNEPMRPLERLLATLVNLAPRLLLVVVIALSGLLLSLIVRRVVRWAVRRSGVEALVEAVGGAKLLYAVGYRRGAGEFFGQLSLLVVLAISLSATAELLGLPGIASAIGLAMRFLPRLASAVAVLLGGLWTASVARSFVTRVGARRDELESPGLAGQVAYYVITIIAVTLAAGQAGIETGLVDRLLQIGFAVVSVTAGLVIAFGSRDIARDMVARHYAARTIRPGDSVRVGEIDGVALRFTAIALLLRTPEGDRLIPCAELLRQGVTLRVSARGDDSDD